MGKLHELLAVEGDLKSEAMRARTQAEKLFTRGQQRLVGRIKKYSPLEEDGEDFPDEVTTLATTVGEELVSFAEAYGRWVTTAINKEISNMSTSADIMVDDHTILAGLPATALLNLESKLAEIRRVIAAIPTNDPSEQWTWDEQNEQYVSKPRVTYRTRKVPRSYVAYEATKEHPAQVEVFNEDIRAGEWQQVLFSGMLAPNHKREMLERLDALARATKQARQRANDTEAANRTVGSQVFAYVFGDYE